MRAVPFVINTISVLLEKTNEKPNAKIYRTGLDKINSVLLLQDVYNIIIRKA